MAGRGLPPGWNVAAARAHAEGLYRSRRARRSAGIAAGVVVVFALLGFFLAPLILRSQLQARLGAQLQRPVTLAAAHVNPFTLRVELDQLHIGEPGDTRPFVDIARATINASWASLFRWAPVLDSLEVDQPRFHVTRLADGRYNFSDILDRMGATPADPKAAPARFALSNISLHGGEVAFDDRQTGASHHIDQIELGLPFLASLPSDADIYVQPLVAMRIDGSPLRVDGKATPFATVREWAMHLRVDHLDMPRYLGYLPMAMPVKVRKGMLTGDIQVHFLMTQPQPRLQVTGTVSLDNLEAVDAHQAPLLEMVHGSMAVADVQPLVGHYHLGSIAIDRLTLHDARLPGGHGNLDPFTTPATDKTSAPMQVRVDTLSLKGVQLAYVDSSNATPARLAIDDIHGNLRGLSTQPGAPASIDLTARMAGGTVAMRGQVDLAAKQFKGTVEAAGMALAPLLAMSPDAMRGTVERGTLGLSGSVLANWANALALRLDDTQVRLDDVSIRPLQARATPLTIASLRADITHADVTGKSVELERLAVSGIHADTQRMANGTIDLATLAPPAEPASASAPFHWRIAHLEINDSQLVYVDASIPGKPMPLRVNADTFVIDGASDDMAKPWHLDLNGSLGKGSSFTVSGPLRPAPADADLAIKAKGLDLTPLVPLISVPLNVRVAGARLSLDGRLRYTDRGAQPARVAYRGDATLGRVRVVDKLSDDDFLHFASLSAGGADLLFGEGAPRINLASLALTNFYARVIVNANGRLNLGDVVAKPTVAPVSVTRVQDPAVARAVAAAPTAIAAEAKPEVHIGQVTLAGGQLNYTDNFIKPNYTANVTQLAGKIGAFGTIDGPPAELTLQGQLDDTAPVTIEGSINPLTPVAFLDIKAKADGVELTGLSPYSGKYAGYPIASGRLTVDVHYQLDHGKLDADNHLFIDQLSFGDRLDGPGISHLPVKLAVALLKNSKGQIDIDVPVTGSLDDPHFSMGGVIWHAFVNLITRAITSPFRLLASAGGSKQDLGYVEFAPGSAVLDTAAQGKLNDMARVLTDKPSLSLDVTGRTDPSKDESGLRQVLVQEAIAAEQRDDQGDEGDGDLESVQIDPAKHDKYLEKAYKHAKFPKPKNFIGLSKDVPPETMITLLASHMTVDAEALRRLGERRAAAVRQYLHGKVDDKRVFVKSPRNDAKGIDDSGKTTRVDFGLH